jgi:glycosyltransferase involved in cell wall biosynthesis
MAAAAEGGATHVTSSVSTNGHGRVAIFTADMGGGGAERAMLKLAGGVARRGYPVDLVLSRAGGDYLPEVPETVRVVDLDAGRVLTSLPGLVRYLRRERPSVMLTSLNHVNIVGLWARRLSGVRTRLVVNEQNTLSQDAPNSARRRHRLLPRFVRRFYPWADGIVAVSKGAADDLARTARLPAGSVRVVHNPIVTPELREMAAAPLDHPWFGPGEPPVALAVGRLAPQKDFGTLLRAFARVLERRPARLLILGEGPERPSLEALVPELGLEGSVDLAGRVLNPYPYMRRAGVFVLSSRWEGLPSVLIEALYCGVPIVATDCPSGPVEILEGGEHGRLVPVGDAEALAEGIAAALDGHVPRPAPASWEPYEQETVVERYLDVLVGAGDA